MSGRARAESVIRDFKETRAASSPLPASSPTHPNPVAVDGPNRCLVFCRLRPSIPKDFEDGAFPLLTLKGKAVAVHDERSYEFDGTFDADSTQDQIFDTVAVPCLRHAFRGFCSALMCYGQTGTGKSFTMCCTKPGSEGIIPRAARYLFDTANHEPGAQYNFTAQFVQIYRDQLGDLMTEGGRDKVDIRCEKDEGVTLPGCSSHVIQSAEQFMTFYNEGNVRRVVTATAMNPESSRGHTALVVWVTRTAPDGSESRGKVTFIDLAGYERFSKTGITATNPIMKDEAKTINASLLSLGHVVTALSNGDKHIPWRNAKLTRLLQDSIGGRSRTSIILTVGPSSEHLHETTNSLQFGMRAMAVKVQAKVTVVVDYEKLASKLQLLLDEKDKKINMLEIQLTAGEADRAELLERHRRDQEILRIRHESELEALKEEGASNERILRATEQHAIEAQNLQEEQRQEVEYQEETLNKELQAAAAEQTRRQQLRAKEMEMAQENLIKEFERKLEDARSGGNTDLIRLMQQLAERDAALVARAQQVAQLDTQVKGLFQQLAAAGIPIEETEDNATTYLDLVQVEEMKKRYELELSNAKEELVETKAQNQRLTEMCQNQAEETERLQMCIESLTGELTEAGLTVKLAEAELNATKSRMVDEIQLELLRFQFENQIDQLTREKNGLESELEDCRVRLKEVEKAAAERAKKAHARKDFLNSVGLGGSFAAGGANSSMVLNNSFGEDSVAGGKGESAVVTMLKHQVSTLTSQLVTFEAETTILKQMLKERGISLEQAPVQPVAVSARATNELRALLDSQDSQLDELRQFSQRLEHSLRQVDDRRRQLDSYNRMLLLEIKSIGGNVPAEPPSNSGDNTSAGHPFPVEAYHQLLEEMRRERRRLQCLLLAQCEWIQAGGQPPLATEDADEIAHRSELDSALKDKDEQIRQREEELLLRAAERKHLASLVLNLTQQLQGIGHQPCCNLPSDLEAEAKAEADRRRAMDEQRQREAQELEVERRAKEAQLNTMLTSIGAARAKEASIDSQLQAEREKAARLEAERNRVEEELAKAKAESEEKARKQSEMDKALAEATRALMEAQARAAVEEERKESNFFSRIFSKKK